MPKKETHVKRLDLRIPIELFEKIEEIAEERNLDFNPKTMPNPDGTLKRDKEGKIIYPKRALTPVVLELISIGLKELKKDSYSSITDAKAWPSNP